MSIFTCPNCSHMIHIFGTDGVKRECEKHGIRLLGDIPLDPNICEDADKGRPTVVASPDQNLAAAYLQIAKTISEQLWPGESQQ